MRHWLSLTRATMIGLVVVAGLAFVGSASASTTPPFTQCPAVGADTSCETLIVVNPDGSLQAFNDPSQGPFDGVEDTLVGVQNNSTTTITSIKLEGSDIFGFDGDGICSGLYTPAPPACPYGPTGYEGPKTSFEATNENEGTVNFTEGALAGGESTYFSLEENVNLVCTGTSCKATEPPQPTTLSTTLSGGGGQSGESITVPAGTPVSDDATLAGTNASKAGGTVTYTAYSDSGCTTTAAEAGTVTVSEGSVPASTAVTLSPGKTYYWQASYSGDPANASSSSPCGAETETVEPEITPPPEECTASGSGRFRVKKEIQTLADKLSSDLGATQKLTFKWNKEGKHELLLTSLSTASCTFKPHKSVFNGEGTASVDGVGGYHVVFSITVTTYDKLVFILKYGTGHKLVRFHDAARTSEVIAAS